MFVCAVNPAPCHLTHNLFTLLTILDCNLLSQCSTYCVCLFDVDFFYSPAPNPTVCLHACLTACPPICLHPNILAYMPACLPTCLPSLLPVCLSAYLPVCLPTYLPAYLSAYLPICIPTCLPAVPTNMGNAVLIILIPTSYIIKLHLILPHHHLMAQMDILTLKIPSKVNC